MPVPKEPIIFNKAPNLDMWLDVNGEKRQRGNTKTMLFGCEHLVWYCSQFFVMEPGDVVTLGIDGLGEQRQKIVPFKQSVGRFR
jgi:2-keto-4-pentenoate hydratase/2-oxohepta-3-ene-1,7-dioic acid hydratase in catechol pathway